MTKDEVLKIHTDEFLGALIRQNYATLEALYSDDYILVRPDGSVLNKQEVLQDLRNNGLTFHSIVPSPEPGPNLRLNSRGHRRKYNGYITTRLGESSTLPIHCRICTRWRVDSAHSLSKHGARISAGRRFEVIRKIEIERFSLIATKPFDDVVAAINAGIGHPNMAELWTSAQRAHSAAELEITIEKAVGKTGLMLFVEFDHGAIVSKSTGRETSKIIRFVIGNPLIMKEMAKHVPDAGSYAPVTVLVDERTDGVHVSYDRMASLLAPYENLAVLEVARNLDTKIEDLLRRAAA